MSFENQSSSVPLPVSATLYNLMPRRQDHERKTRPEYTADLLVPVRLDIVLASESEEDEVLLFSAKNDLPCIHPKWDRLDERVTVFNEQDRDVLYRSLRLKMVANEQVLAEVPLHPSLLRRLPSVEHDSQLGWEQRPPPRALPPNSVLVEFDDGSTRVYPELYHLLLAKSIIEERDPSDALLLRDENEEHRRMSRFADNVFDALNDDEGTWQNSVPRNQRSSPSSLLETDDESKAVPIKTFDCSSMDVLSDTSGEQETPVGSPTSHDLERKIAGMSLADDTGRSTPVNELRCERQELERLVAEEESCLQLELDALQESKVALNTLLERVRHTEDETKQIETDTIDARQKHRETDFLLEAQRIKLLKDFRTIYPIQCRPEQHYFIRGLEIPFDLHSGIVNEDEISAALGFLCHTLAMMGKYLAVSFRYRIVCNSSRSAIQEDATTILPLFQARAVEAEQLNRGMELLHRNVACLLKARNVSYLENSHILCKVKRIYDSVFFEER